MVAGGQGAAVLSRHAADSAAALDVGGRPAAFRGAAAKLPDYSADILAFAGYGAISKLTVGEGAVLVLSRNAADIRACAGHGAAYNITFAEGAALVLSRNAASFTMFASSAPEEPAVALATMSMSMFSCFTFFK